MGNKGELLLSNYTGSKSLSFLCVLTSLSIDQINFICSQFAAIILSFILKRFVKDPNLRIIYCLVAGITICNFCFGVQIFHVIISGGLSYAVICKSRSSYMPWYVFTVSMLYLSWLHIRRQFFELAPGYSLDITGPLMVLTQKVTSLAFALNDGKKQKADKKISELEKLYAIGDIPESLEYWSFIFQFQSMLAGPLVFFKEYREFIYFDVSPSSVSVVVKKLGWSIFFVLLYLKVAPQFDIEYLRDDDFLQRMSFLNKLVFICVATTLERTKYYHAWILSDAVCNASGLGYNKETQTWDLVTNVDAIAFERGSNLKESLDQWNKGTMRWLRYVVYERCSPSIRTVATYTASAFWHGFYPGYYMTFFSGALFTGSARIVRRLIRPLVLNNSVAKFSYDFITWLTTRIVVAYASFTFVLLDFTPSLNVYMDLFFFLHIAAGSMFLLPTVRSAIKNQKVSLLSTNGIGNRLSNGKPTKQRINSFPVITNNFKHSNSNLKTYVDDSEMTKLKTG